MQTYAFIVLVGIINSTLYVNKPTQTRQCLITLDFDNEKNSSYPQRWKVMEMKQDLCSLPVNESSFKNKIVNYKLRYYFNNGTYTSPPWLAVNNNFKSKFEMSAWSLCLDIFVMIIFTIDLLHLLCYCCCCCRKTKR